MSEAPVRYGLTDMTDVTVCAPCDQGAAHPESHTEDARILLETSVGIPPETPMDRMGEYDGRAAAACVHAARAGMGVTGAITVHKGPMVELLAYPWVATQP